MGKKEESFYSYSDQYRQLIPVDPRLQGFSVADWFRSVGNNRGLSEALVALYGVMAYRDLVNHFNTGSGYATSRDFWENNGKRNAIEAELMKRFQTPPA